MRQFLIAAALCLPAYVVFLSAPACAAPSIFDRVFEEFGLRPPGAPKPRKPPAPIPAEDPAAVPEGGAGLPLPRPKPAASPLPPKPAAPVVPAPAPTIPAAATPTPAPPAAAPPPGPPAPTTAPGGDPPPAPAAEIFPIPRPKPAATAAQLPLPPEPVVLTPSAAADCAARLGAFAVKASALPPIEAPGGCRVPAPLLVSEIGTVKLSPPATMACPAAEALARWTVEVLVPEVEKSHGTKPAALAIGASYDCRPRNHVTGARLSEHGVGNAVDIMAVRLASGATVAVGPVGDADVDPRARLLRAIRAAACRHFTTVLGPGSDASHADHLHFDLARRRNGMRLCQ